MFFREIPPRLQYIFILNFSLPLRSKQRSGVHANEIKHDHEAVDIVVLDPRYDINHTNPCIFIAAIKL